MYLSYHRRMMKWCFLNALGGVYEVYQVIQWFTTTKCGFDEAIITSVTGAIEASHAAC